MRTTLNSKQLACTKITKLIMSGKLGAVINSEKLKLLRSCKQMMSNRTVCFFRKNRDFLEDSGLVCFLNLLS